MHAWAECSCNLSSGSTGTIRLHTPVAAAQRPTHVLMRAAAAAQGQQAGKAQMLTSTSAAVQALLAESSFHVPKPPSGSDPTKAKAPGCRR